MLNLGVIGAILSRNRGGGGGTSCTVSVEFVDVWPVQILQTYTFDAGDYVELDMYDEVGSQYYLVQYPDALVETDNRQALVQYDLDEIYPETKLRFVVPTPAVDLTILVTDVMPGINA